MIGKKINQLATELAPASTDLTIIGNPTTGVSKKITLAQLGAIFSGAVSFYTNLASFPATGDINVIYCAKDTQKLYLWSGSAYVEVFPSQALLDTYQLRSEKGVSNGYASLDSSGKVPISQLPSSIMEYKGTWSASTNTPTLANGTGDTGDVYICNVAGTVNFGAGPITFAVGDYVIYSGSIWQRSSGAVGTVTSVALSRSGDALAITGSPITTSGTINIGFAGTGAQYIKGDGTLATFPSTIAQAERLITEVYNSTGATLTKGTIVYINGGQGNLPTVTKALATGDSTSAQTFGVVQADITNMNNGYVVVAGKLSDLDTQAYTPGTPLYLSSTTAGTWTSTKQYAPNHLVYIGIVVRAHPTQGIVEIKIQNGYEMSEIHDVAAQTPTNNDGLFWESATSLWKNKSIATILGGTPVTGSGTLYALTKWGFTSGAIINSNLYDTGSVIYNNNATAGAFAVQFNGNATSGMSYGLLINAGSDANDIALRIQNVSSTSEYFFVYGDGKVKMNNIPNATTDTDTFLVSDGGFIKYRTGAQLLSDIGGQAALTNPVTGTGTTNYLPKFTGTTSIGNSLVYDTGSEVLVGTATRVTGLSGYTQLEVSGSEGGITINSNTTTADKYSRLMFTKSGATGNEGLIRYNVNNYHMSFWTNATEQMRLNASGNLGLGVNPSAWRNLFTALQVGYTGALYSTTVSTAGEQVNLASNYYQDSAGNELRIQAGFATRYQQASGEHRWSTAGSSTAGSGISFTQAMTLNASGNLSIGNTNDTYKLDVSGTGRMRGVIIDGANNANVAKLNWTRTDQSWSINNETNLRFYTGSGNTLSPSTQVLEIATSGAATFSSSVTATQLSAYGASNANVIIAGINSGSNNPRFFVKADESINTVYAFSSSSTGSDNLSLGVGGGTSLYIKAGGNVGIGTTSPSQKLDVNGKIRATDDLILAQTNPVIGYDNGSTGALRFASDGGNTERMRITSGGNVLLGTTLNTTGFSRLVLNGGQNGNESGIQVNYGASTNGGFAITTLTAAGGGMAVYTYTGNVGSESYSERMRITSGGNVGIGTSSPLSGYKLTLVGSGGSIAALANGSTDANFYSASTTIGFHIYGESSTAKFYVVNGGQIYSTSTSISAISDIRHKENIRTIETGLNEILALKPSRFDWKQGKGTGKKNVAGFIAQDIEAILPDLVDEWKEKMDSEESFKSIRMTDLIPTLVKAIQELKAELDTLKNK